MSLLLRPFRALLAEGLAIGLLVVLFGLPLANLESQPDAASPAYSPPRTEARIRPTWPTEAASNAPVREHLGQAASAAGNLLEGELDRLLAPFVAARSADDR